MGPLFSNKVKMLSDRLKIEKYPHNYDTVNNILVLPHAECKLPEVPENSYYISSISCKNDVWGIVFQVAMRGISETDPKFSEKNTKYLLEEAAKLYRERQPNLTSDPQTPAIKWDVDLTYVGEDNVRYGVLDGIFHFSGNVNDAYTALAMVSEIPITDLVEVGTDDQRDPQDAVG